MMKALVTGGGGFLGRVLAERLQARGDGVTVLGRRRYADLEAKGMQCAVADLGDRDAVVEACRGCDVVFHVAARAGVWGPHAEYVRSNVDGTRNVLEGCRAHGVGRLVYTSSPSVTFDGHDACGADESLPYPERFETSYSETKAEAERMVLAADGRGGLSTVALRPHLIWGPGDPHLVPRVVATARAGRLMQVGDGTNRVDLTYVDNAARAHVLAGDRLGPDAACHGKAYFISDGAPVVLWAWIRELLERLGVAPVRRSISVAAARRIGAVLETVYRVLRLSGEPRMTRFVAAQLGTSHWYDLTAARRDLGYEPEVSGAEGFERLVRWMEERGAAR